jgi:hypothetical protein
MMSNFSYSSFGNSVDLSEICTYLSDEMKSEVSKLYNDPSSVLYLQNFEVEYYPLLFHLDFLKKSDLEFKIPKKHENQSIDRMLCLYLLLLTEVTRENFFTSLAIKMIILLRQYLNIVGWENLKSYHDFQVHTHRFVQFGEYTANNTLEEIPGLINDFVSIFIDLDKDLFGVNIKHFLDIVHNFCNWLFINEFTNYKVVYIDEEDKQ